jgi:hypothetical protein
MVPGCGVVCTGPVVGCCSHGNERSRSVKYGEFIDFLSCCRLLQIGSACNLAQRPKSSSCDAAVNCCGPVCIGYVRLGPSAESNRYSRNSSPRLIWNPSSHETATGSCPQPMNSTNTLTLSFKICYNIPSILPTLQVLRTKH